MGKKTGRVSNKGKREDWLDVLKLIACAIVFTDHFYYCFKPALPDIRRLVGILPFGLLISGNLAVCLFIMISTMLVGMSVYRKPDFSTVRRIAFKRYPRLFLPVFILSFITWGMSKLSLFYTGEAAEAMGGYNWIAKYYTEDMSFGLMIRDSVYGTLWNGDNYFSAPFWMLSILFLGTFMALILAVLTARREDTERPAGCDLFVFAVMIFLSYFEGSYMLTVVLGCFLAYLRSETDIFERISSHFAGRLLGWLILVGSILVSLKYKRIVEHLQEWGLTDEFFSSRMFYRALTTAGILTAFLLLPGLRKALGSLKLMKKMSVLSFAVYLVHWPILCSFTCRIYVGLKPVITDGRLLMALVFAATAAVVLICAWLFWRLIEKGFCDKVMGYLCKKWEV